MEHFDTDDVVKIVRKQFERHNLPTWRIEFGSAKTILGTTIPSKKKLRFSKHFIFNASKEDVMDTILHEMAHVIDFYRRGKTDHGPEWQAIASELGATPKAVSKKVLTEKDYKYRMVCPNHGTVAHRHTRGRRNYTYYCTKCKSKLKIERND